MSAGKRLRRESIGEEDPEIKEKLDGLKNAADQVAKASSERLSLLEQAVPLASHLHETQDDIDSWFNEMEGDIAKLQEPSIDPEQIKQQQDNVKVSAENGKGTW